MDRVVALRSLHRDVRGLIGVHRFFIDFDVVMDYLVEGLIGIILMDES